MPLRCIKIDALGCKFQHVQYFAPDFEISRLSIFQLSNGFQHNDGISIIFHVTSQGDGNVIFARRCQENKVTFDEHVKVIFQTLLQNLR